MTPQDHSIDQSVLLRKETISNVQTESLTAKEVEILTTTKTLVINNILNVQRKKQKMQKMTA